MHSLTSNDQFHDKKQAQATIGANQNPTWSMMRLGRYQCPSSPREMVDDDHHGWGPRSKGICCGHYP
jgi:hypothetical protein